MGKFQEFLMLNEAVRNEADMTDIRKTINKLPKTHKKLLDNYKFSFESGNTLKGDKDHIGLNNLKTKHIVIASPWNYGREYTFLHEVAHLVWEHLVNKEKRKEWSKIVKSTKDKQNQNNEELFAMAYADYYAKNKIVIHHHKEWEKFISNLPN